MPNVSMGSEANTIFTDGGMRIAANGTRHAGFGIYCNSRKWQMSFRIKARGTTLFQEPIHDEISNNLAELMAIYTTLTIFNTDEPEKRLKIATDSQYAIHCIGEGVNNWVSRTIIEL